MPPLRAVLPALAAAGVLLLAGSLYVLGYRAQYHALLQHWGAFPFRVPFLDMHGVTAAIDCARRGFDVYVQNPCDVFGRVHAYSPVWLWLGVLPVTTGWDVPVGIATDLLFLAALPLLPAGRGWWQVAVITLCTMSGSVAYALERANVDLMIFLLVMLAVALSRYRRRWRIVGYAVALLAAMLKFYPVTLLVLAVRERLAACVAIGLAWLGALALWFALDGRDILRGMANIPTMDYLDNNVFGVRDLPFGLAQALGMSHAVGAALLIVLLAGMLGCAAALAARNDLAERIGALTVPEAEFLLLGSGLMIGCFFAAPERLISRHLPVVRSAGPDRIGAAGASGRHRSLVARNSGAGGVADVEGAGSRAGRCRGGATCCHLAGAGARVVGGNHRVAGAVVAASLAGAGDA